MTLPLLIQAIYFTRSAQSQVALQTPMTQPIHVRSFSKVYPTLKIKVHLVPESKIPMGNGTIRGEQRTKLRLTAITTTVLPILTARLAAPVPIQSESALSPGR